MTQVFLHLMVAISPGPAVLLVVVFANETTWNTLVARIFSFNLTKAVYIKLKIVVDRGFGGMLAILGDKSALTLRHQS
ncbi:MAG: hypothetical protein WCS20_13595 [Alphaproteobacteria bacterium]